MASLYRNHLDFISYFKPEGPLYLYLEYCQQAMKLQECNDMKVTFVITLACEGRFYCNQKDYLCVN